MSHKRYVNLLSFKRAGPPFPIANQAPFRDLEIRKREQKGKQKNDTQTNSSNREPIPTQSNVRRWSTTTKSIIDEWLVEDGVKS